VRSAGCASRYFLFFAAGLGFERDAALAGLLAFFGAAFTDLLPGLLADLLADLPAGLLADLATGFAPFFAGAAFFAGAECEACAA
jgi:hypothetical protein